MDPKRTDILARIVADKAQEVIAAQLARPYDEVVAAARAAPPPRDSATWYSSTMNSLRSTGSEHAARAATR